MTDRLDRRSQLRAVRLSVWRAVSRAAADARADDATLDADSALAAYREATWEAVCAYLRDRSDGLLPSPPGGIGATDALRHGVRK